MGRERSYGDGNSRARSPPTRNYSARRDDTGYGRIRHSHDDRHSRHRSKSQSRSPNPSRSRSRSQTPPTLNNKQHVSKRSSSNVMSNGRIHHNHDNGYDRGRRRGRSRSGSRSRSLSQSRSISPHSYHRRLSAHHRDDARGKHRASPTRVHGSPSRSRKSLSRYSNGYSRESGQVGLAERTRRHGDYDSDRGGRSSPTYLPYSVHDHVTARDHDRINGYDSDEKDLENLSPHEYRRVKRERLRKRMAACIWRVTPSPPRDGDISDRYRGTVDNGNLDEKGLIMSSDEKAYTPGQTGADVEREEVNHPVEKFVAVKGGSPSEAHSDKNQADSSSDEDRPRKQKKKPASKVSHRHHTGKAHALKDESTTESSQSETSSSESDDRQKSMSRRKERNEKSRRKKRTLSSKKKGKSRKRRRLTSSDEDNDDDQDDVREILNKSPLLLEKGSASPSSSFERYSKDSSLYQSNGETDKDDDAAVEIDEEAMKFKVLLDAQKKSAAALENEPIVGPAPAPKAEGHISYGGALRPGEGDAIAQYVQQGKRIPRRGEVGLSAEEISKYEGLGYVMSGSRHQRMNAIRIRKENQVYSAEDKRALAMFNYEEKAKREHQVMSDLQRLIQRHIGQDPGPTHDPFAAKQSEPQPDT
ncbi:hypothetical protein GOP47_0014162 [Adiantum capillus-veneris]|uniref:NF-kappa-B-activating protein C-terminal domain-containing protein n=1 Tax=Adiantum capillus-veneris TaxID=13818 RepID=A0A9D4UQL7_ADICA|nr:hypothetical protein GOP47_0014162 [Adiantum capillus-veneris]